MMVNQIGREDALEDQTIDALQTLPNAGAHWHYLTGPDCSNIATLLAQ